MALLYIIIALVIQGTFINANVDSTENEIEATDNPQVVNTTETDDVVVRDFSKARKDWIDFLLLPDAQLFPTSSISMMTQTLNPDRTMEEQLEDIKEYAKEITLILQSELASLLEYAISSDTVKENKENKTETDNNNREKRSVESPMASTKLVNRLLKHIKSNNEYQNVAIEKMMTAQEIADKYGIEFSPDTEIISDLAFAANKNAKEITDLLHETLEMKNASSRIEPVKEDTECPLNLEAQPEEIEIYQQAQPAVNHYHYADSYPSYNYYYNYPYETQIQTPVQYYNAPVTRRPNFYDAVSYSPDYYPPYCSMEPVTTSTTFVLPYEEVEPEPELVGEEFEETVSSKVYVDRGEEPGSATVNHVMTYTIAEKSHFRTPEIEKLPQQMQYCFFLM